MDFSQSGLILAVFASHAEKQAASSLSLKSGALAWRDGILHWYWDLYFQQHGQLSNRPAFWRYHPMHGCSETHWIQWNLLLSKLYRTATASVHTLGTSSEVNGMSFQFNMLGSSIRSKEAWTPEVFFFLIFLGLGHLPSSQNTEWYSQPAWLP